MAATVVSEHNTSSRSGLLIYAGSPIVSGALALSVGILVEPLNGILEGATLLIGLVVSIVSCVLGAWFAVEHGLLRFIACLAGIVYGTVGYCGTILGYGLINYLTL